MGGASMPLMVLLARGVERFDILFQLGGMERIVATNLRLALSAACRKVELEFGDNFKSDAEVKR
jgi:hypothetical protein